MLNVPQTKRQKMVASGSYFERKVASMIIMSIDCKILINPKFYSHSLHRGTECDLLVISPSKIYCIECKNYNGFISGNKFDETWNFVSSGKLGHVQNPYLLNNKHIRLIRGTFYNKGLRPLEIENIIVVPDKCNIHVEDCNVVNLSELMKRLSYEFRNGKHLYNIDLLEKYFNDVIL